MKLTGPGLLFFFLQPKVGNSKTASNAKAAVSTKQELPLEELPQEPELLERWTEKKTSKATERCR